MSSDPAKATTGNESSEKGAYQSKLALILFLLLAIFSLIHLYCEKGRLERRSV